MHQHLLEPASVTEALWVSAIAKELSELFPQNEYVKIFATLVTNAVK